MEENQIKLTPKNDVIFKRLFGQKGHENIVKDLIEAILEEKIESVDLGYNNEILPDKIEDKVGVLDVKVKLSSGVWLEVEMQNIDYGDIEKRMMYYLNLMYLEELKRGKKYSDLKKVISIGILNFEYFKDIEDYHTIWKMTEQKNYNKKIEDQEIHFIEIPKFLKSEININRKIDQWLCFIDYSREELVKMAKEKNDMVQEASAVYDYLVADKEERDRAYLRMKYELDYNSGLDNARKQGMKIGIEKIVKNMIQNGIDIDLIKKVVGIKEEEIEEIRKKYKIK